MLWRLLSVLTYRGKREKGEPAHESGQCIRKWTAAGSGRPEGFSWSSLTSHFADPKVISLVFWQILGCRNFAFGFAGKVVNSTAQRTDLWLAGWKRWKAVEKTCLIQILFQISKNTGFVQINTVMNSFTLYIFHYLLPIKCLCSLSPHWAPKQKQSSYLTFVHSMSKAILEHCGAL